MSTDAKPSTPIVSLRFYPCTGFFAWLIRLWTWCDYAHVELRVGDRQLRAFAGERTRWVPLWNTKDMLERVIPASQAQASALLAAGDSRAGGLYDWEGIALSQAIPLGAQNDDRDFCSEVCAFCLIFASMLFTAKPAAWYSPRRLLEVFHA